MNSANPRKKQPELMAAMEDAKHSKDCIGRIRREIEHVLPLANSGIVASCADVHREYEKGGASADKLARKKGIFPS
jgi:hypothetical protein